MEGVEIIKKAMSKPYLCQLSFWLIVAQGALGEPLCNTALWKRPWLPGESRWKPTDADPALSPKRVTWKQKPTASSIVCSNRVKNFYYLMLRYKKMSTFEESPPKAAMFLATQWRAKRWSSRPALPLKFLSSGKERKPKAPTLCRWGQQWEKMLKEFNQRQINLPLSIPHSI